MSGRIASLTLLVWLAAPVAASAQAPASAQPAAPSGVVRAIRTSTPVKIDGDLSDPAWRAAVPAEKFYEIQPGDNVEPPVKSVGYLLYDDRFLYVGLDF